MFTVVLVLVKVSDISRSFQSLNVTQCNRKHFYNVKLNLNQCNGIQCVIAYVGRLSVF